MELWRILTILTIAVPSTSAQTCKDARCNNACGASTLWGDRAYAPAVGGQCYYCYATGYFQSCDPATTYSAVGTFINPYSDCCYPYSCACPHSHNPHGHNPHSHNPHGHTPHSHNPHGHTPHGHTTASPPSPSSPPPSPLTCASKGITDKCCYDGPSGQPEYVCGATSKCAKGQCLAATNSLCTDGPVATPDYVCSATQSCGRGVCVGATFTLCGTSGTTTCGATLTCCGSSNANKNQEPIDCIWSLFLCPLNRRSDTPVAKLPYVYMTPLPISTTPLPIASPPPSTRPTTAASWTVSVTFLIAGNVATFDKAGFEQKLRLAFPLAVSVQIAVTAGSVIVTTKLGMGSSSDADRAKQDLRGGSAALSTRLGVEILAVSAPVVTSIDAASFPTTPARPTVGVGTGTTSAPPFSTGIGVGIANLRRMPLTLQGVFAIGLLVSLAWLNLLILLVYRCYDRMQERLFVQSGGAEAMEAAGISLPGITKDSSSEGPPILPPAEVMIDRKPKELVNPRKAKSFWGLQSVPEVATSGVNTIDKIIKPSGKLVVSMTRSARLLQRTNLALRPPSNSQIPILVPTPVPSVHNAIFHISNNIKQYAASRLGAPEMDSPRLKHGLPELEIFTTAQDGSRIIIAKADCVNGLEILSKGDWSRLDNDKQKVPCTELIANCAEWLVFCHATMSTKKDMELELLDDRTSIPLLAVSDNGYETRAPWVTTRVRYGGFLGFCKKERTISLEEMLQRAKVRTASGRRANRRAAKAQLKKLEGAHKEMSREHMEMYRERLELNCKTKAFKASQASPAGLSAEEACVQVEVPQSVTFVKPNPDSKIGITLQSTRVNSVTTVQSIVPGGLAATSGVQAGDRILSINSQPVIDSADATSRLLQAPNMVILELVRVMKEPPRELSKEEAELVELSESIAALGENITAFEKGKRFARRSLKALAKRGYLYDHRRQLSDLHYIDPRSGSASLKLFEESGGAMGWVKPSLNVCGRIVYSILVWPCKMQAWYAHADRLMSLCSMLAHLASRLPFEWQAVLLLVLDLLVYRELSEATEAKQARANSLSTDEAGAEEARCEHQAVGRVHPDEHQATQRTASDDPQVLAGDDGLPGRYAHSHRPHQGGPR